MISFKVTTVGASAGFILTKEAMARMNVKERRHALPDGSP